MGLLFDEKKLAENLVEQVRTKMLPDLLRQLTSEITVAGRFGSTDWYLVIRVKPPDDKP